LFIVHVNYCGYQNLDSITKLSTKFHYGANEEI
jgi:hypothetical protein